MVCCCVCVSARRAWSVQGHEQPTRRHAHTLACSACLASIAVLFEQRPTRPMSSRTEGRPGRKGRIGRGGLVSFVPCGDPASQGGSGWKESGAGCRVKSGSVCRRYGLWCRGEIGVRMCTSHLLLLPLGAQAVLVMLGTYSKALAGWLGWQSMGHGAWVAGAGRVHAGSHTPGGCLQQTAPCPLAGWASLLPAAAFPGLYRPNPTLRPGCQSARHHPARPAVSSGGGGGPAGLLVLDDGTALCRATTGSTM